jgi:hypothetical protein
MLTCRNREQQQRNYTLRNKDTKCARRNRRKVVRIEKEMKLTRITQENNEQEEKK